MIDNMTNAHYLHLSSISKQVDLKYQTNENYYPIVYINSREITEERINTLTFNHVYINFISNDNENDIKINSLIFTNGSYVNSETFHDNLCSIKNIEFSSYSLQRMLMSNCNSTNAITISEPIKTFNISKSSILVSTTSESTINESTTFEKLTWKSYTGFSIQIEEDSNINSVSFELLSSNQTISFVNNTFPDNFYVTISVNEYEPNIEINNSDIPISLTGQGKINIKSSNTNDQYSIIDATISNGKLDISVPSHVKTLIIPIIKSEGSNTEIIAKTSQNNLLLTENSNINILSNNIEIESNTQLKGHNLIIHNITIGIGSSIQLEDSFIMNNSHINIYYSKGMNSTYSIGINSEYTTNIPLSINLFQIEETTNVSYNDFNISCGSLQYFTINTCKSIQTGSIFYDDHSNYELKCIILNNNICLQAKVKSNSTTNVPQDNGNKTVIIVVAVVVPVVVIGTIVVIILLRLKKNKDASSQNKEENEALKP